MLRRNSASGALKYCYKFLNPGHENLDYQLFLVWIFELFPEFQNAARICTHLFIIGMTQNKRTSPW
jgi:hypothetical protein